jgi:hypothetical protein
MKRIIGFSMLLLLGVSCSTASSPKLPSPAQVLADSVKARCDKIVANKDEFLKNSGSDYDVEIMKYKDPTDKKKEEVRRSSWSFRALNYLMVQNPSCFEPVDVAWAQFWIDSFNRSEQIVKD